MSAAGEPIQEFFSIGEVCELTDLKPHVLRYWESQFRFLSPAKNRSGNRVYQRREIELIAALRSSMLSELRAISNSRLPARSLLRFANAETTALRISRF